MKLKLLIASTVILLATGCETLNKNQTYSKEREVLPSVSIDLQKDIQEKKVVDWNNAHNLEGKYLALINYLRVQKIDCGCGDVQGPTTVVTWRGPLYSAAKEHSNDMAKNDIVSENGSGTETDITAYNLALKGGSSPKQRAASYDYKERLILENSVKTLAQSVDVTDSDIVKTVESMLYDKKQCAHMMNGYVDSFAMAQSTGEKNGKTYIYWTQLFGGK